MDSEEDKSLISLISNSNHKINLFIVSERYIDKINLINNLKKHLCVNYTIECKKEPENIILEEQETKILTERTKINILEIEFVYKNSNVYSFVKYERDNNIFCFILNNINANTIKKVDTIFQLYSYLFPKVIIISKEEKNRKLLFKNINKYIHLTLDINNLFDLKILLSHIENNIINKRNKKIFNIQKIKKNSLVDNPKEYSLIYITKQIYNFLKNNNKTSTKTVIEHILKLLNVNRLDMSFKTIQRRICDSINVLHSLQIVDKDNNYIFFKGNLYFNKNFKFNKTKIHKNTLEDKRQSIISQIDKKYKELISLYYKFYLGQSLIKINKNKEITDKYISRLEYPFYLLKNISDSSLIIKKNNINNKHCIISDESFEFISDRVILDNITKDYPKLRENFKFYIKEELLPSQSSYIDKFIKKSTENDLSDLDNFNIELFKDNSDFDKLELFDFFKNQISTSFNSN